MYENYLKRKQIEWKETVKEKKTKEKKSDIQSRLVIPAGTGGARPRARPGGPFSLGWYNQLGLHGAHQPRLADPGLKGRPLVPDWGS